MKSNALIGHGYLPPMIQRLYLVLLLFLSLSGFGQMPIFKRYYIADIPGFGWLAKFFVTHTIHYLSAAVFLSLAGFVLVDFWLLHRDRLTVTVSGYLRGGLLAGILLSGVLLVIRNLPGYRFSPVFIIVLDIVHLGLVLAFFLIALACLVLKKKWTKFL